MKNTETQSGLYTLKPRHKAHQLRDLANGTIVPQHNASWPGHPVYVVFFTGDWPYSNRPEEVAFLLDGEEEFNSWKEFEYTPSDNFPLSLLPSVTFVFPALDNQIHYDPYRLP